MDSKRGVLVSAVVVIVGGAVVYGFGAMDTRNELASALESASMSIGTEARQSAIERENLAEPSVSVSYRFANADLKSRDDAGPDDSLVIGSKGNRPVFGQSAGSVRKASDELEVPSLEDELPPSGQRAKIKRGEVIIGSVKDLPREIREVAEREIQALKENGYVEVPEEEVANLIGYLNRLLPQEVVRQNTKMSLADLRGTPFGQLLFLGLVPEGPDMTGPWDSVTHVYRDSNNRLVLLNEWDYRLAGGGAVIQKEAINVNLNGYPAILVTERAPSGASLTEMSWYTEERSYTLTRQGAFLTEQDMGDFLALARAVPIPGHN